MIVMVSKTDEERIIAETKQIVRLFLDTNLSDIEISKMTGFSSSTVGRRLTNKNRILKAFPEDGENIYQSIVQKRSENAKQGKLLGGQVSMLNYGVNTQSGEQLSLPKLRLEIFSKNEEKQIKFLIHIALTFRVKLPILSQLFQIGEKELLELILKYSGGSYKSILYLFYHDSSDQTIALNNLIVFYRNLVNAIKNKDLEMQKIIISQIDDSKARDLIKNKNLGDRLSLESIKTILRYQLKYALTQNVVADIFEINQRNYRRRLDALLQQNQELSMQFYLLSSFNDGKHGGRR